MKLKGSYHNSQGKESQSISREKWKFEIVENSVELEIIVLK